MDSYDRKPQTVVAEHFKGGAESAESIIDMANGYGALSCEYAPATEENQYLETISISFLQGRLLLVPTDWLVVDELSNISGMPNDAFHYTYNADKDD